MRDEVHRTSLLRIADDFDRLGDNQDQRAALRLQRPSPQTKLKTQGHRFEYRGCTHHASEDEPQYEIKSSTAEHIAIIKVRR